MPTLDAPVDADPRLGRLVQRYGRSRAQLRTIVLAVLISAGIAALFFYGASTERALSHQIGLSVMGCFISIPAIAGLYVLLRGSPSVRVHDNGILHERGNQRVTALWDEIASYTEHAACRVETKDGRVLEFGAAVSDYDEIAATIEQKTLERLLPQAESAIDRGSSVEFRTLPVDTLPVAGALAKSMLGTPSFSVDREGITSLDSGERIAWSDCVEVAVGVGAERPRKGFFFLVIRSNDLSFEIPYGLLPNAHVLSALCEQLTARAQSASAK